MVMRAEWRGGQETSPGLGVEVGVPRLTKQQEWGEEGSRARQRVWRRGSSCCKLSAELEYVYEREHRKRDGRA